MMSLKPETIEKLFLLSDETTSEHTITHPPVLGFADSEWIKDDSLLEATGILIFCQIGNRAIRLHCSNIIPQKVSGDGSMLLIEPLVYELTFEQKILITLEGIAVQFHRGGLYGEQTNIDYRFFDLWLPPIASWLEKCNDHWIKHYTKKLRSGDLWQRIVAAGLLCHRVEDQNTSIHNFLEATKPRQLALKWSQRWSPKSTAIVKGLIISKLTILLEELHILEACESSEDIIPRICRLVRYYDDIWGVIILLQKNPIDFRSLRQRCNHVGSTIIKKHQITFDDIYDHEAADEQTLRAFITLPWHA